MSLQKIKLSDWRLMGGVIAVLQSGGVVMHPTETCYGLCADISNKKAVERVYALKGRDFKKPLSILVDGLYMAQEYGFFSDLALDLAKKYWPGPLSILVPCKKKLPDFFNSGEEFVALRWSSNAFCQEMVKNFGSPLITTSANKAGEKECYEISEKPFADFLAASPSLIVDGGKLLHNKPSTIVKVNGDNLEVLRQGDLIVPVSTN
ncbi:threonylcarbamoyl-AMP synthase [Candidatus Peregrinibacteria bacterium]|nr:threonylcarbamoyl-AMP synthase [Candidatus Peregrinibacteria bacterium]